jgi:hypothetical protein
MRSLAAWLGCAIGAVAACAEGDTIRPVKLALQGDDESVYAKPMPPSEGDLYNQGGVNLDLRVRYMTDHVFRGVDRSEVGGREDATNLQFEGLVAFNLGQRVPHPFLGVFVNVFDSDPVSRFQEIRPIFGAELKLRPLVFAVGHNSYIFPNREDQDTTEGWAKVTLMDGELFRTPNAEPILSPYILAAYDYGVFNGWYFEAGIRHEFVIEGTGLTLTVDALASYSMGIELFAQTPGGEDTGFQRWEIGLTARYSLNQLLNIPRRYGQWAISGYVRYTDNLSDELRADTQVWGGVGIEFSY